jgi:hypothetical protein
MYSTRSGLVLGFHGCDELVVQEVLNGKTILKQSSNNAVIETVHTFKHQTGQSPFDSVRSVFYEGNELYPNAGFREKDHVQICVRNPNCIKGFFLPRDLDNRFEKV